MADETYFAFVDCYGEPEFPGCGRGQGLTMAQYELQMSRPDSTWRCPHCMREAIYNDTLSEKAQGIT